MLHHLISCLEVLCIATAACRVQRRVTYPWHSWHDFSRRRHIAGKQGCAEHICAALLLTAGAMMMENLIDIDWSNVRQAVPAFITIVVMPLTYSIAYGVIAGICSYLFLYVMNFGMDLIEVALKRKELDNVMYDNCPDAFQVGHAAVCLGWVCWGRYYGLSWRVSSLPNGAWLYCVFSSVCGVSQCLWLVDSTAGGV